MTFAMVMFSILYKIAILSRKIFSFAQIHLILNVIMLIVIVPSVTAPSSGYQLSLLATTA